MRIISGKYKGRRLIAPKKLPVRPTTDRAKEGLFNILANRYEFSAIRVIDLFSGTGNIAYEFASRGIKNITAVDQNRHCATFIAETATGLEMDITILKNDVFRYLENTSEKADLVFADPPYHFEVGKLEKIITLVFENKLLAPHGMLVLEHGKRTDLSTNRGFLEQRNYGSSVFSFFEEAK